MNEFLSISILTENRISLKHFFPSLPFRSRLENAYDVCICIILWYSDIICFIQIFPQNSKVCEIITLENAFPHRLGSCQVTALLNKNSNCRVEGTQTMRNERICDQNVESISSFILEKKSCNPRRFWIKDSMRIVCIAKKMRIKKMNLTHCYAEMPIFNE